LPSKSESEIRSNRHLTQSRRRDALQRDNVYSALSKGQGVSEVGQLFCTTYGCGDTGRRSCQIVGFCLFWPIFPIQNPQNVPSGDQPAAQGLHRRISKIFPCGSRRFKGVPSGPGVFLRLLLGELGTPKLVQIFAYGKWLYPCRMLLHGASDLDQRCLKTRNSEDGCTFPPSIFVPTPQNHSKTPFWGTFQCKAYYTRSSP